MNARDRPSDHPPPRASWRDQVDRTWTGDWDLPAALTQPLEDEDRYALAALSMAGLGPRALASRISGHVRVRDALHGVPGPAAGPVRACLNRCGARVITPGDDQYPPGLREIQAPPPILFVRGRALGELGPGVSIVGSRVCTGGAARFASELAESIARAGFTVVSGLARGIDGAAHRGALRAGDTIAVLGAGIDIVYPAEHRELAKGCERSGAIVSEFPPGVRPKAWHFPARNRIISGWSLATIVVEGGERSGSLITASFALDQGRDVFACTTAPRNPAGAGVRALLREGARLIVDVDDAVRDLRDLAQESGLLMEATASGSSTTATEPLLRSPRDHELSADAALVLPAVLELTTVDHLVAETGLVSGRVSAGLLELELLGLVADDGGGRWRRM